MARANKREKRTIRKDVVLKKDNETGCNLDDKLKDFEIPHNKKEVIDELESELKVSDNYKVTEKRLKKESRDEKDAIELGEKADVYYTAKEKEDEEDELGGAFGESSHSHPREIN